MESQVFWEFRNIKIFYDGVEYRLDEITSFSKKNFIRECSNLLRWIVKEVEFSTFQVGVSNTRSTAKMVVSGELSDPFEVLRRLCGSHPWSPRAMFSTADVVRVSSADFDVNLSGNLV